MSPVSRREIQPLANVIPLPEQRIPGNFLFIFSWNKGALKYGERLPIWTGLWEACPAPSPGPHSASIPLHFCGTSFYKALHGIIPRDRPHGLPGRQGGRQYLCWHRRKLRPEEADYLLRPQQTLVPIRARKS